MPPCITGLGLISPLGGSVQANFAALLAGRKVTDHTALGQSIGALADHAALEATSQAHWGFDVLGDASTALLFATGKGDVKGILNGAEGISPFSIFQFPLSLKTGGPRLTLSAACASGLQALIRAAMLLQSGRARRVLVIAAEAAVHPLFLGGFGRMGVLCPPRIGCRPFDQRRRGFLLSEAAAAICLERFEDSADRAIVAIDRFALGADAHHLTGCDPSGITLSRLIADCLEHRPVDLIHAHGTATVVNDTAELAAIESGVTAIADRPRLYSHKAALGHTLGASGLVSIVLTVLCHQQGVIPPNLNTSEPLDMRNVCLSREIVRTCIKRSLVLAAGFGGTLAAVTLRSHPSAGKAQREDAQHSEENIHSHLYS